MGIPYTRSVGEAAEQIALDHLLSHNLKLVERNFRCRLGEVDLVMLDGNCLVFIEVRFRKPNRFASAAASVDGRKQAKLIKAAAFYIGRNSQFRDRVIRFDVVALDGSSELQFKLQWLKDAFRP